MQRCSASTSTGSALCNSCSTRPTQLLIFQAMDAAGKDGAIKHVMSGVNPQGCQVSSFKQPSTEELDHDFLWRTTLRLPERGRIGIFNRSYYEEVLVVRVHPEYLAAQRLPDGDAASRRFWDGRLRSIRDHEAHLHRNGTHVIKFFLHVSPEVQRQRFLDRIDDPGEELEIQPWRRGGAEALEKIHVRPMRIACPPPVRSMPPGMPCPPTIKQNARLDCFPYHPRDTGGNGPALPEAGREPAAGARDDWR